MTPETRIRVLRKGRGVSVRELARLSGLSPSLVSQVERGVSEPSISSLRRIAEALDTSIFHLLNDHARNGDAITLKLHHVPRKSRKRVALPGSGLRYELLSPDTDHMMEAWIATLEPGRATSEDPSRGHAGEEFLLVLGGEAELEYDGEAITLLEGDSVYLDGRIPHRLWARGDRPLRFLSVLTPPVL